MIQNLDLNTSLSMDRTDAIDDASKTMHSATRYGLTGIMEHLISANRSILESVDEDNNTPLIKAAIVGQFGSVEYLVKQNASLEARNNKLETPLLAASSFGHANIVNFLIDSGSNYTSADENGYLNVHLAAKYGHVATVKSLISKHPKLLEWKNLEGATPLWVASNSGQSLVVDCLLKDFHANIESRAGNQLTPLMTASAKGNVAVVRSLVENGAQLHVTVENMSGYTAIHFAAANDRFETISFFRSRLESSLEIRTSDNDNALCVAVISGSSKTVKKIIDIGGDLESRCSNLSSPLILACYYNQSEIVSMLLEEGANAFALSNAKSGSNAGIHWASYFGYLNILKILTTFDKKLLELQNGHGGSALWESSAGGHIVTTRYLLDYGVNLESFDSLKRTPLHACSVYNHPNVTALLLQYGANTSAETSETDFSLTPFVYSAKLGNIDVVRQFLKHDPSIVDQVAGKQNGIGVTALFMACQEGHVSTAEVLLLNKADVDKKCSKFERTPLLQSVYFGHIQTVELLLRKSANIWSRGGIEEDDSNTVAILAAKQGHVDVLKLLFRYESNLLEATNRKGLTPLHVASESGQVETVEYLLNLGANTGPHGSKGYSVFLAAAATNQLNVLKLLMDRKEGIYSKSNSEDGENMAIHIAAAEGNLESMDFLLHDKADFVFATNKFGDTPLILASYFNNYEEVESLLRWRSNIEVRGRNGWTAFLASAFKGNIDIMKKLVEEKVNVLAKSNSETDEQLAIHLAARQGHLEVIKFLVENNLNEIEAKTKMGNTPLVLSSQFGHLECVKWLMSQSANIEVKGENGWTPLLAASAYGRLNIVSYFVENHKANVNVRSSKSSGLNFAIHLASGNGHISTIDYFLKLKRDYLELKNGKGWTPLLMASSNGKVDVVEYLANQHADLFAKSNKMDGGNTALHIAAIFDKVDVIRLLISKNSQLINLINDNGETALWRSSQIGNTNSVAELMKLGANSGTRCASQLTPLTVAAMKNRANIVRILESDSRMWELDRTGLPGNTPFHWAALYGHIETLHQMLNLGADVDLRNQYNESAMWLASYGGARNAISFLIAKGASLNVRNRNGWTLLHAAAFNGHQNAVMYLIRKGLDPFTTSSESDNLKYPIHLATTSGYVALVKYFSDYDRNLVEVKDSDDHTPLWLAASYGLDNVVQVLLGVKANALEVGKNDLTPFHIGKLILKFFFQ